MIGRSPARPLQPRQCPATEGAEDRQRHEGEAGDEHGHVETEARKLNCLSHEDHRQVHRNSEHAGGHVGREHRAVPNQPEVDERMGDAQLNRHPEREQDEADGKKGQERGGGPAPIGTV
jgi:hypothetical protein